MDLLFKRYASPFLLLDCYIRQGRLSEFVCEILELHNNDEIWNIWLHKVHDKSFNEFKEEIDASIQQEMTKEQIETTINDSKNIILNFNPNES